MTDRPTSLPTTPGGLVLFHGAGGHRDHRLFLALEEQLPIPVARLNFPYRDLGPKRPPPRVATLLPFVADEAARLAAEWDVPVDSLVLGGRSMGGRVASMAVAEGLVSPAGLLLLSYPLHPPGKPEKLRVEHLPELTCPALVLQGDADPFGRPAEFDEFLPSFGGGARVVAVGPGGHDPTRTETLVAETARWLSVPLSGDPTPAPDPRG